MMRRKVEVLVLVSFVLMLEQVVIQSAPSIRKAREPCEEEASREVEHAIEQRLPGIARRSHPLESSSETV